MGDQRDACLQMSLVSTVSSDDVRCSPAWDDLYCWPSANPGEILAIPCIEILGDVFADAHSRLTATVMRASAYRKCGGDGYWDWNNWTNYSECLAMLSQIEPEIDYSLTPTSALLTITVLVLSFCSFFALIIATAIFVSLRSLTCIRIRVHKNLCVSLLLHCFLLIVISSWVILHPRAADLPLYVQYEALCKIVKTLGIYSSMATIYWMFIEGLVLHKSLYSFNGNSYKWPFFVYQLIGWLLPTVFVGTWIGLQELLPMTTDIDNDGRPHCWQGYGRSNLIYIITVPMMLALVANICFLINIIRILVIKLRNTDATETMPRAIQATAFLIPLLGLEQLIFCINPTSLEPRLESIYVIVNGVIQSVQGMAVAFLYFFTNKEVQRALKASWTRRRLSSLSSLRSRLVLSSAATTMSPVLSPQPSQRESPVVPKDFLLTKSLLVRDHSPHSDLKTRVNSV